MSFADWLTERVSEQFGSRNAFAKAARVDSGLASRWLNGERHPTRTSCQRIADGLGLPLQVVLNAAGYDVLHSNIPEHVDLSDPLIDFFGHNFDKLTPEDREKLMLYAIELIDSREAS